MFVESILPVARGRLNTIQADALLTDAAKLLGGTHKALVVVCDADGVMVGVITKTDIVRQIGHYPESVCSISVSAVMTREVAHCRPSDSLRDVLSIMNERGFVHVPIINQDSRPSGVVNARDALRALLGEVEDEQSLLRNYVMGIGYR